MCAFVWLLYCVVEWFYHGHQVLSGLSGLSCGLCCCLCMGCLFAIGVAFASIPVIIGVSCGLVARYLLISCIASWCLLCSWFVWWTFSAYVLMNMWLCTCAAIQYFPWCLDWYLLASCVGTSMPYSVFGCVNSVCVCVCMCVCFEYILV